MPLRPSDPDSEFLFVEEGESRVGMVAEVAPLLPVYRTYTFAVPEAMAARIAIGRRVRIPVGRTGRGVPGYVVGLDRRLWESTLRPVDALLDEDTFLTSELVVLGRRIAAHYACPLGKTLHAITPEAVRRQRGLRSVRYVRLLGPIGERRAGERMSAKRSALLEALSRATGPVPVKEVLQASGASPAVLRALVKSGTVEVTVVREAPAEPPADDFAVAAAEPDFALNDEQRAALAQIDSAIAAAEFSVTLLFGVSGSGKTEVYVHAMRRVLAAGRQAILLVPEIVLTTQLVQRLAARFAQVAVVHSALSESQRSLIWRDIAVGLRPVVIGTRSAVFAPCPALGLICVDEEQEGSYKNLQAPRFHVRDVAILRASLLGIPVVLGSATPSLETWHHSTTRKDYRRVALRRRVLELPMPRVQIVDMRDEWGAGRSTALFSRAMEKGLEETLARGEQALILINRRGYAHRLFCAACRSRVTCPNCQVGLVLHATAQHLTCHYCRYRGPAPKQCSNPACGSELVTFGAGTQHVEQVLAQRFPTARIRRADSDTMHHRRQYQTMVDDFAHRQFDVLVGTQMIAKGLDFPAVSFVGVIDADPVALAADFRAEERLFQLITQVAGRAGRAESTGRVVVQTTMPDLPSLNFALRHDYESFAAAELEVRRRVGLSPFRRLARIVVSHAREETAEQQGEALAERVRGALAALAIGGADVLGPNPCALRRLRRKYRYDLVIRTATAADLHRLMDHVLGNRLLKSTATVIVDVDPVNLM